MIPAARVLKIITTRVANVQATWVVNLDIIYKRDGEDQSHRINKIHRMYKIILFTSYRSIARTTSSNSTTPRDGNPSLSSSAGAHPTCGSQTSSPGDRGAASSSSSGDRRTNRRGLP